MADLRQEIRALQVALEHRYEIRREVGQGAHATVFLAQDLRHDRQVALKVLRAEADAEEREIRFSREIKFLARLQHPNILPLHDSGHVLDMLYYVVPFIEGASLREKINREKRVPVDEAVRITRTLAEALEYAHRKGVIHRDIKPENILLSGAHPILADFGVARAIDAGVGRTLTQPGLGGPGTPAYMSPEQLLGHAELDARSDVYSLGCVLYEMLAGSPPFAGKDGFARRFTESPTPLSRFRPDVPAEIERAVLRAMEREPEDRFATAGAFAAALESRADPAVPAVALTRRQRVPAPPTLVGREQEIAELGTLLERHALVTLVGPGGVGKTSLALHVAQKKVNDFRDGSALIPLVEARSSDDLVAAIGEAIGVTFAGARSTKLQLLDAIADRDLLLVLDGFEHLMSAAALVGEIMRCGTHIRILVTSRERLNIADECVLEVGGLPLGASTEDAELAEAGMTLFLQRARQTDPNFEPPKDRTAIRRILHSVSGLPLGIEIAASLLHVLSCDEIADELERDPGSMATSRRDIPERQRSLREVFEQSWALLDKQQRSALMRLSVLRGSFSRDAAQAVSAAGLGTLGSLLDKSLLHRAADGRFTMHDVVRQFAASKLHDDPDANVVARDAQMEYFAKRVAALESDLRGALTYEAVDAIARDLESIREGWRRAIECGHDDFVQSYLDGLFRFYVIRGRYAEGVDELAKAESRGKNDRLAALVLARRGSMALQAGLPTARLLLRRSIEMLRVNNRHSVEMGVAYRHLGFLASEQGRHRAALRLYDRAFKLLQGRAGSDEFGWLLLDMSVTYTLLGEYAAAERVLNDAAGIFKQAGEPRNQLIALINLSIVMTSLGRLDDGLQLRRETVAVARRAGDLYLLGAALINLAESAIVLGNYGKARELLEEARKHHELVGRPHGVCKCELFTARVDWLEGNNESAKHRLRIVVMEALRLEAIPLLMEAALEFALLCKANGRDPEAKALASLVLSHPATGAYERQQAEALCASLGDVEASGRGAADRLPEDVLTTIKRIVLT